jgi:TP901 family phage tail tape measure protein
VPSVAELILLITGKEQVSKTLKTAGDEANKFGKTIEGVGKQADSFSEKLSRGLTGKDVLGLVAGGAAVAAFGGGLLKLGLDFDHAYDKIRIGTGATGDQLKALEGDFKSVFTSVPTDMGKASTAIAELNSKTGATGATLDEMAKSALNLSRLTGTDLSDNIDRVTKLQHNWGVANKDVSFLMDKLFTAAQKTGQPIGELVDAVLAGGPAFRALGIGMDQSIAIIASLSKAGIDAGSVVQGLNKAISLAAKEGKPAGDAIRSVFEAIQNAVTPTQALTIAVDIFGSKAGPKMADAIRSGAFSVDQLTAAMQGSQGAINQTAKDTDDFGEKLTILKNKITVALEPLANKVFDLANRFTDWLIPALTAAGQVFETELLPKIQAFLSSDVVPFLQRMANGFKDNLPGAINTVNHVLATFINVVATTVTAITTGFGAIVRIISVSMQAAATVVSTLGQAIYQGLQWINPFATHSPALVDQVRDGMNLITANFGRLAEINASLDSSATAVRGFEGAMSGVADGLKAADLAGTLDNIKQAAGGDAAAAYSAAAAGVASLQASYDALTPSIEAAKSKLEDAGKALDDINTKISAANGKFDELSNTPLLEEKPFDAKAKAIDTDMTQLQLKITKLKQQGPLEITDAKGKTQVTALGKSVETLQKQLDQMGLAAQQNDLEKKLAIDPLKDKLDSLTETAPKPFAELFDGMSKAKGELAGLTAQQAAAQPAYDAAKAALDSQTTAYDTLGQKIAEQTGILQTYAQMAATVVQQQQAAASAAEAASKAAGPLAGLPDATGGPSPADAVADAQKTAAQMQADAAEAAANIKTTMDGISENIDKVKGSFQELGDSLKHLKDSLGPIGKFFDDSDRVKGLLVGVAGGFAIVQGAALGLKVATGAVEAATAAYKIATGLAAAAQWLLNIAMDANPAVLIALAIVALVAILIVLEEKYGFVTKAVDGATAAFKAIAKFVTEKLVPAFTGGVAGMLTWLGEHWPEVATILSGPFAPIVLLATDAFGVRSAMTGAIGGILDWVGNNWGMILSILTAPFTGPFVAFATDAFGVRSMFTGGLNDVVTFIGTWASNILTFFTSLPGNLKSAFGNGFDFIWDAFKSAINYMIRAWNGLSFSLPAVDTHIPGVGKIGGLTINTPYIPELKSGLDYVPFDNFPAILHKGERVVPAAQNGLRGGGGSGGGLTVNFNGPVTLAPPGSPKDQLQTVGFAVASTLRRRGIPMLS